MFSWFATATHFFRSKIVLFSVSSPGFRYTNRKINIIYLRDILWYKPFLCSFFPSAIWLKISPSPLSKPLFGNSGLNLNTCVMIHGITSRLWTQAKKLVQWWRWSLCISTCLEVMTAMAAALPLVLASWQGRAHEGQPGPLNTKAKTAFFLYAWLIGSDNKLISGWQLVCLHNRLCQEDTPVTILQVKCLGQGRWRDWELNPGALAQNPVGFSTSSWSGRDFSYVWLQTI